MAITPHKMTDSGARECKACGAEYKHGRWWNPKDQNVDVGEDCDEARRIMYPKMGAVKMLEIDHRDPLPLALQPPQLTPAQIERLAFLMEEAGEVIQAAAKILRHGYESHGYDNRGDLAREFGDVVFAMGLLFDAKDVSEIDASMRILDRKKRGTLNYLHHQGDGDESRSVG
jgi:NTP pyrophosphatase (non-canonical NTP hydrolase)